MEYEWVLPTRHRLPQLQAMLDQCVATGMTTPGTILVSEEDYSVKNNGICDTSARMGNYDLKSEGIAAKIQEAYSRGLVGRFSLDRPFN